MFAIRKVHFCDMIMLKDDSLNLSRWHINNYCDLENSYIFIIKNEIYNMFYVISNMLRMPAYLYTT